MGLKFNVRTDIDIPLAEKLADVTNHTEHVVAQQVLDDTEPFVPMLTGSLLQRSRVYGNVVIYPGPYARYLYNGKVMVNAQTGKGPMNFVDKDGTPILRFPKGSKLKATDKDLVFTKAHHPDAQSHWFEASKAQNLQKWLRGAAKEMEKIGK